jgi:hypothetical protein
MPKQYQLEHRLKFKDINSRISMLIALQQQNFISNGM